MKFDDFLFAHLGEMGKYQKIQFILVTIPTLLCSMHALSWTFVAMDVPYRCALDGETTDSPYDVVSDELTLDPDQCFDSHGAKVLRAGWNSTGVACRYQSCSVNGSSTCPGGFVFEKNNTAYTAVQRWELVCTHKQRKAVVQMMYYIGQAIGSIVFGILGDMIGRKKVFFIAIMVQCFSGVMMSIVPFWWLYAFFRYRFGTPFSGLFHSLRLVTGFSHPGIFVIAVVIGMELVGPRYRKLAGVASGIFFALGQVLLGLVAMHLTDYRWLQFSISLPGLLFMVYWIVPESARWLVSKSRFEEADEVLRHAAKVNGTTLPEKWWETLDNDQQGKNFETGGQKKYSMVDLFRTPVIRKRALSVFFLWPVVSMVYYGMSMKPDILGGDPYMNFVYSAIMEVPALIIVYLLIDRVGRRPVVAGGYFIAGFMLLSSLAPIEHLGKLVALVQLLVARGAITAVYASIYTFSPELFPTTIRNTAMGVCSTIARIGASSASFITMGQSNKLVAIIPFGACALLAGIVTLVFLPETMGKALPATVEEVEGTPQAHELQVLDRHEEQADS